MDAVRMFSVNTWIIIICVAIFFIDGMLPMRAVLGNAYLMEGLQDVPATAQPVFEDYNPSVRRNGITVVPLLDRPGGAHIGFIEVFPMRPIEAFLHFSTNRGFMKLEVWRLIGFQFLHSHEFLAHLLFNMLGLFFFGPLVERHLGSKRYLAFYLLCGIFGALMYTLLNMGGLVAELMFGAETQIPFLLFNSTATPLIGASAGVFGVLMAGAYLAPNATVLFLFVLPMKLRTLAYALVAFALFSLVVGRANAGGEAGHLGGALAGWYFIRNQRHLHGFFDFLGRADPTSHHYRNHKPKAQSVAGRREVDRILDKISSQGMHSLTDKEKRILREASREGRR